MSPDALKMGRLVQADALVKIADQWARRGLHIQAHDAYRRAGEIYMEAGDEYSAAVCEGKASDELGQVRPPAKPNVAGLVD